LGAEGQRQLIVTGRYADGVERDLTREATFAPNMLCAVSRNGLATPRSSSGTGKLVVRVGSLSTVVQVQVRDPGSHPPARLVTDVVPILTKNGCNQGACHGAAAGQNGFKLSLRGFDPELDFEQIVKEKSGARIDRERPAESLLLKKAAAEVPHAGGERFKPASAEYQTLLRWVKEGALGPDPAVQVAEVTLMPEERILARPGSTQQLQVVARYSDGSTRDVTLRARFVSNNEAVATVDDASGLVKAERVGTSSVMVSYSGFVKVARFVIPVVEKAPVDYAREPRASFVDELALGKLAQLRIAPSPDAPDAEFLRRVYLDVIGTLPTPEEAQAFLADRRPDRRARLIDALLERPEFVDYRTTKLSDLLRVNSLYTSQEGADTFYRWIRNRVRQNVGYDAFVRELLTARGSGFHVGPANFYRIADDPEKLAETVSQTFLGVRLTCAKCHNHPFEKWQQKDYYSLAAFFARLGRKGGPEFGENQVVVRADGEIKHPKTQVTLAPRYLGGDEAVIPADADRRVALADWLGSTSNRQFAQVAVNRLWAELFGVGIVDPVDDFRVSNPASNPALLEALGSRFAELKFDTKAMLRLILNSRTYQRSSTMTATNAGDSRHFARAYPRRLPAEVLADALDTVLARPTRYGNLPPGTRATQLPDARTGSYFLQVFGRPKREIVCACERDPQPNLSQMLNLTNSTDLNDRLTASDGRVARVLKANLTDDECVRQFYLAALSRPPTAEEQRLAEESIRKAGSRKEGLEDLLWALVNSQEFVFNH
jgi:hypothetical protein